MKKLKAKPKTIVKKLQAQLTTSQNPRAEVTSPIAVDEAESMTTEIIGEEMMDGFKEAAEEEMEKDLDSKKVEFLSTLLR